ncbi:late competence development ComFB family protein [Ferrimonas lipolytica]|uniref:Late competence development ComFB family protein n=1 Tax=Ferrimonas lipolytica TaxID=2724191 RepID=A0A6H1UHD4_9GAMM|nr:late competence development ComFB family protein [Ferrimonas lipolytica]QIZ77202.1 late competence development ComFB family protein [Ferrimonas lipolytica]
MDWDIRNYYEYLVKEAINERRLYKAMTEDELMDLLCLTLNQLPAKYIRYHIDMVNSLTVEQRNKLDIEVTHALDSAFKYLASNPRQE